MKEHDLLHQKQIQLEKLYSKNQLIPRIRAEFEDCPDFDFAAYMREHKIHEAFGFDLLIQMALHKRANLQTLIGLLFKHLQSAQATADMLKLAAKSDLVDWSPDLELFITKYEVSADVQEDLDRFQFPLPMVVQPKKLKCNRDSGYLENQASVILRNNHHEDDVCLDHLNRLNKIKLTINPTVVKMVKNQWKNLDKPKEGETFEDFQKRKAAFNKYDRTARDVIDVLMEHSDHFYLTHRYDKRGRTYCMGYHCNYQGNAWSKAIIELADKEIVDG